jgi:transcriptional regulator with XRE-family HTH domain
MNWEYMPRIAELRESKQLTQLELANQVGVTETTIANWERGRSGVEWLDRLIRLCSALECTPEDLLSYIPKFENEKSLSELIRLIEEGQEDQGDSTDEQPQDLDRPTIESLAKKGGKFSDILKLIEAGQQAQAKQFPFSAPPALAKGASSIQAGKKGKAK